jgi:hypothetical protein
VEPTLAHALSGAAGGVAAGLYLVAAISRSSSSRAGTSGGRPPTPAAISPRRMRVAGAVCALSLILGLTATWWVPHDDDEDTARPAAVTEPR